MNIAQSKGEKAISTLAKRLLAEPSKGPSKTSQKEMEAALLRLNPHLKQIGNLKKGTPILVPEEFRLAANESVNPFRGMAEELLRQEEAALTKLRTNLKHAARSAERRDQARKSLGRGPKLKEISPSDAAKALAKEQAKAIAAQERALKEVQAALAQFRPGGPDPKEALR